MAEAIKLLGLLVGALVEWIRSIRARREERERQDEHDKIEEDPAQWLADHFSARSGGTDGVVRGDDEASGSIKDLSAEASD